jgi:hypothetical protein
MSSWPSSSVWVIESRFLRRWSGPSEWSPHSMHTDGTDVDRSLDRLILDSDPTRREYRAVEYVRSEDLFRLKNRLEKYEKLIYSAHFEHKSWCKRSHGPDRPCDCGLLDAWISIRGVTHPGNSKP